MFGLGRLQLYLAGGAIAIAFIFGLVVQQRADARRDLMIELELRAQEARSELIEEHEEIEDEIRDLTDDELRERLLEWMSVAGDTQRPD